MNRYNNQIRSNRSKNRSGSRKGGGKNGFLSVFLFYVLPFTVVNSLIFFLVTARPKGEITIYESNDYISTTMELKIKSLLPVNNVEAALEGSPIELTKTGARTYTAVLNSNGMLGVKLTSFNKMKTIIDEPVVVLDDKSPTIKYKEFKDGILSICFEDSQSGVDFSSILGCSKDNQPVSPISVDQSTGLVAFEIKEDFLTIIAKDNIGNEFHKTFSSVGDSIEDEEPPYEQPQEQPEA